MGDKHRILLYSGYLITAEERFYSGSDPELEITNVLSQGLKDSCIKLIIPSYIDSIPVRTFDSASIIGIPCETVVLPSTIRYVPERTFCMLPGLKTIDIKSKNCNFLDDFQRIKTLNQPYREITVKCIAGSATENFLRTNKWHNSVKVNIETHTPLKSIVYQKDGDDLDR